MQELHGGKSSGKRAATCGHLRIVGKFSPSCSPANSASTFAHHGGSTLARSADAFLDRLWPGGPGVLPPVSNGRLLAISWAGYLAGAVVGALLLKVMAWPLLVPAALLLLLLI